MALNPRLSGTFYIFKIQFNETQDYFLEYFSFKENNFNPQIYLKMEQEKDNHPFTEIER
jgi:hypothetical protein